MSNEMGNALISQYGAATRFGAGRNCPQLARRKVGPFQKFRRLARLLASTEFSIDKPLTFLDLVEPFRWRGGRRQQPTVREVFVATVFWQALNGNLTAMSRVILWTDGPAPTAEEVEAMEAEEGFNPDQ